MKSNITSFRVSIVEKEIENSLSLEMQGREDNAGEFPSCEIRGEQDSFSNSLTPTRAILILYETPAFFPWPPSLKKNLCDELVPELRYGERGS